MWVNAFSGVVGIVAEGDLRGSALRYGWVWSPACRHCCIVVVLVGAVVMGFVELHLLAVVDRCVSWRCWRCERGGPVAGCFGHRGFVGAATAIVTVADVSLPFRRICFMVVVVVLGFVHVLVDVGPRVCRRCRRRKRLGIATVCLRR